MMVWTNEKPTKPGYYYFRYDPIYDVVIADVKREAGFLVFRTMDEDWQVVFEGGQWAGPIEEPMEAR